MTYRLAIDGDDREKKGWGLFLPSDFPAYEQFWLKHVVPLTNRPANIHFKGDATLAAEGKVDEDLTIAQLHYTVLKHLLGAHQVRQAHPLDEFGLFVALSSLTGAQDVAFELLQRCTSRGKYDPWMESRPKGKKRPRVKSGQDAQEDWKKANQYPLQHIRDYRNKLIHGRTPPAFVGPTGLSLPAMGAVDKYCDWRKVTDPVAARKIPTGDFESASMILDQAWRETLRYLEETWRQHLI